MAAAIWLTPAGDLGIIPELEYYEIPLDAYNPAGGFVGFTLIAGNLPDGLELYDDGRILGIPVLGQVRGVPVAVNKVTTSTFTIRIKNIENKVSDRTFNLTVAGIDPPVLVPSSSSLGSYIDGTLVNIQLEAVEANPLLTATFTLIAGELPIGLTLSADGLISGYLRPIPSENVFGPFGPTWAAESAAKPNYGPSFDWQNPDYNQYTVPYDSIGFDAVAVNVSKNYQFTIQADDGVNTDVETYTIFVYSRTGLTADNDILTADNVGLVTADTSSLYSPVLYTDAGTLASIRQNTNFAYQLIAEDYDSDAIQFVIASGSLPPGLTLNASTGWITGLIPYGSLGSVNYNFSVYVQKTTNPTYVSATVTYTLKVLGQIDDTVVWLSPADLGSIYNGAISEFYIEAETTSGRFLRYELDTIGALPIGLELLSDGVIAGRVSFETLALDNNVTSIDGDLTTFDQVYTFAVNVFDNDNFVSDQKEFTISVIKRNIAPYENLYIQALPNRSQRALYDSIINNSDLIPTNYIYRQWDPWFGKNTLRRVLFMTGLNPDQVADYISAMELNHYWKTLNFGEIKTAKAVDSSFNTVYEVVYIELIDPGVNSAGVGPDLSIAWPTNTQGVGTVYPNSFPNMIDRIAENIGYENRSILPTWMTSRQTNGTVLGFTRALVLTYTIPGKSEEVAYRIRQVQDTFKLIDFTIDRYEWDSVLSTNYEKTPATGTGNITATTQSNVVIGTGTNFSHELIPTTTIYVSGNVLGNVNVVSNTTTLSFTANALSNVNVSAFTYSTNVFIINNFVSVTGTINANTNSNVITGVVSNVTGSGTITGNVNSTTITGSGTSFNTQLAIGKNLYYSGNSIGIVTSIRSANVLTLSGVLSANLSNVAYTADGTTTLFARELYVGDTIVINTNVILGTVQTINSNTNLVLYSNSLSTASNVSFEHTARDPYTTPTTGDQYLKFPQVTILA